MVAHWIRSWLQNRVIKVVKHWGFDRTHCRNCHDFWATFRQFRNDIPAHLYLTSLEQLNWPRTESLSRYQFGPFQSTLADLTSASDALSSLLWKSHRVFWKCLVLRLVNQNWYRLSECLSHSSSVLLPMGSSGEVCSCSLWHRFQASPICHLECEDQKICAKTSWGSSAHRFCWKIVSKPDVADFHSTLFRVGTMNLICKKRKCRS